MTETLYPYGQSGELPEGYPIANDLDTNDARQALSAAMGYKLARGYRVDPSHWYGKKWHAFGTSITDTNHEGVYPLFLSQISGLDFVNHALSGSGITKASNQYTYNAIMSANLADADLITLECGANDENAQLGTIYDALTGSSVKDNSTLCGALNLCIRHLQATTNAQIVVIASPSLRKSYDGSTIYDGGVDANVNYSVFDEWDAMRKVCLLNSVYYIPAGGMNGMGFARMNASDRYNIDSVHHTNVGGYNFAQAIWSQLKNIPLFYTSIPI